MVYSEDLRKEAITWIKEAIDKFGPHKLINKWMDRFNILVEDVVAENLK